MRVTVCGLGAVGSNVLEKLALQHPEIEFMGIDFDKVEERNIKTQAYTIWHIGQSKATAIQSVLYSKQRKVAYISFNKKLTDLKGLSLDKNTLVLDCFDNVPSRKLFQALDKEIPCLHIGFSPTYTAEIIWNEDYDVPDEIDPSLPDICDLGEAVSFIGFVTSFAAMVIDSFIKNGKKDSFLITGKYKIKQL